MKSHEVLDKGSSIRVRASTRAGLLSASLAGLMEACGVRTSEAEVREVDRPFSIEAEDFGELLGKLLTEAATMAVANKEAYADFSFTLITDKKAVGSFVGKPAVGFHDPKSGVKAPDEVLKNEAGEWDVTLKIK